MKKWIFAALALCVANPAAAGAPEALPEKTFELGMKYANAAQPDWNKALEMFRLAADWGDARAQHALGRMYHQGTGVARDDAMASALLVVQIAILGTTLYILCLEGRSKYLFMLLPVYMVAFGLMLHELCAALARKKSR